MDFALQIAKMVDTYEPSTKFKDVVSGSESAQWLVVIGDEMESLQKNQTWYLVERPKEIIFYFYKRVFKKKLRMEFHMRRVFHIMLGLLHEGSR